jgi:hypothetical protein
MSHGNLWVGHHAAEIPGGSAKYGPYFSWFVEGLRSRDRGSSPQPSRGISSRRSRSCVLAGPGWPLWLATIVIAAPTIAGAWRLARRSPVVSSRLPGISPSSSRGPSSHDVSSGAAGRMMLWLVAGALELWEQAQRVRSLPDRFQTVAGGKAARARRPRHSRAECRRHERVMLRSGAHRGIARVRPKRISPTVAWVRQHTPPERSVASDDENAVFLYTGRRPFRVELQRGGLRARRRW